METDTNRQTITKHIKNIYETRELNREAQAFDGFLSQILQQPTEEPQTTEDNQDTVLLQPVENFATLIRQQTAERSKLTFTSK